MGNNVIAEAVEKAKAAVEAAKAEKARQDAENVKKALAAAQSVQAQAVADAAKANIQAAIDAVSKAKAWKDKEETIEDALEHAGISGVDVQIDSNGFAKLVGVVTSDLERDTAISITEQFELTGMDSQLKVEPAPAASASEDPFAGKADEAVKYKVKAGESWWGIAARVYGDGTLWKALKAANNNPKMIHPGTEIVLPPKGSLKK